MIRKRLPTRMIEIEDLLTLSPRCVRVLLKNGMRLDLPRDHVEFVPRAVMVPEWLYDKVMSGPGVRHEGHQ